MLVRGEVEVVEIEDIPTVCVEHIGPYKGDSELFGSLFGKLFNWAGPKGLVKFPETKMFTVYYCDSESCDVETEKISVCISAPESVVVDSGISRGKISAGKYIVGRFEVTADEYGEAWAYLYEEYFPKSGLQMDEKPSFELYLNDPESHPEKKHIVDIYIPVK